MAPDNERAQRGIQSIEVGGQLLRALVHHGRALALKALAHEADMTPARAHPYMVSFGRLGLVEQDDASGHYRLGPLAVQLGLIGLQQVDPVRIAMPLMAALALQTGQTIGLAVWGARGATMVHIAQAPAPVHVSLQHGTVFSMTHTASGRLFAAYLPALEIRKMLEAERRREKQRQPDRDAPTGMPPTQPLPSWRAFQTQLEDVRAQGASRSTNEVIQGISAMAAPVFDHTGKIVLALTAIGPSAVFDTNWHSGTALALSVSAHDVSTKLGAPPGAVMRA